jgi:ABC-type Fe3+ transport system permease subunit
MPLLDGADELLSAGLATENDDAVTLLREIRDDQRQQIALQRAAVERASVARVQAVRFYRIMLLLALLVIAPLLGLLVYLLVKWWRRLF